MIRRVTTVALVAGCALAAVGIPAPAARVSTVPAGRTMVVAGHGWGHGHGMSQEGANGAAGVKHLSANSIVSFYYPHTTAGSNGNPAMRIKLSTASADHADVAKPTGSGAATWITDLGSTHYQAALPTDATKWRFTAGAAGITVMKWTGTAWQAYSPGGHTSFPGPLNVGYKHATAAAPIRLIRADGSERDYRGSLQLIRNATSSLSTLSIELMEDYLLGVVPRESPSSWPAAALQAQAIAARSYAEYQREHAGTNNFDICDTTSCQVFGGSVEISPTGQVTNLEAATTNAAVHATAGSIRTYGGKAIFAQFSASNGGWSTDGGAPYLIAQADPYDGLSNSTSHSWRATLPASALESKYPSIGTLRRIRVTQRDGNGEWGGRVLQAVLEGSAGSVTVTGSDIYHAYSWPTHSTGLRHQWFQILPLPPADFDGNAATDTSTWRSSNGRWYFRGHGSVHFGTAGDIPVPADYDGDGKTDVAVFRPSSGNWYIQGRPGVHWGAKGDVPVPGDYNGDGVADIAVWRPSSATWHVMNGNGPHWGQRGDVPVPADYNGDGTTEYVVWRPSNGRWYRIAHDPVQWGQPKDVPVPGDYNGNGTSEFAVWRPSTGTYYVRNHNPIQWGQSGDVPAPGDYNSDGITDLMIWRPSNGNWYFRGAGSNPFGLPTDQPLPLPSAIYRAR